MAGDLLLVSLIVLPFAGSLLTAFLRQSARQSESWLAATVAVVCLAIVVWLYPSVADGHVVRADFRWLPELGVNVVLRLDGFSALFAGMVCAFGALIVIYARYYMSTDDPIPRFFAFFQAFMGSMLGIVISGNLIQMAFFWELTSLFSFLLIGYWYQNTAARDGARMSITVTGTGGFCLLAGVIILGQVVGSYDLDVILSSGNVVREHPYYLAIIVLIGLGALTKSAQFPFHFWLPSAMAAPTPVSAYLHSATMVKAGIFLLARLWPVLAGTQEWFWLIGFPGLLTLLLGAYLAIFQRDIKGLLAYSTISHLGLMTLLLGMGSPLAAVAAIFHVVNHATFKASLFMAAGIIDHEAGTRDMRRLSGLYAALPITGTLAMVAAAAMAGVPLLNGFLSKEMFFAEAVYGQGNGPMGAAMPYLATLAGIFSVAYSLRFILGVFFGPKATDLPHEPHEPSHWMRFPIELLVLICLVVGVIPAMTVGPLLGNAMQAILGANLPEYSLSVWHGFNLPLLMSFIALGGGVALYAALHRFLHDRCEGAPFFERVDAQRVFEQVMVTLSWRWARGAMSWIGTRKLQPQLRLLVFVTLAAGAAPLYAAGLHSFDRFVTPIDPVFAGVWLVGMVCAVAAAQQAKFHRLAAMILLGGAGLIVSLTFAWFSAPDLALTQVLVEIVTSVLILLGLRWLPERRPGMEEGERSIPARLRRGRDLLIAVSAGLGIAGLSYAVMTRPLPDTVSKFFVERAYTAAGGRNVVNVILVDFRAFDTFGEVVVLGIVGLAVYALLRRFRPAAESLVQPEQQRRPLGQDAVEGSADNSQRSQWTFEDSMLVPSLIMRVMFPVIGAVALYLFLRGHDLPGGGFIAGLTLSIAFILQYMAAGTRWVEDRLVVLPIRWIGTGLLIAGGTGTVAMIFGLPFLTSYFAYLDLPLIGRIPAASALFFDLGVFAAVVGATVLTLIALAHQSVRRHRRSSVDVRVTEGVG